MPEKKRTLNKPKDFRLNCFLYAVAILLISGHAKAQDTVYAHSVIDSLCSPRMHGRGYVFEGDRIAADFITGELIKNGIKPFTKGYRHDFTISVNTFPGEIMLILGNDTLEPGSGYVVDAASPSVNGTYKIKRFNKQVTDNGFRTRAFFKEDHSQDFVLIDTAGFDEAMKKQVPTIIHMNAFKAKGIIETINGKPGWNVSQTVYDFPLVQIRRELIPDSVNSIKLTIENRFQKKYKTANIAGFLEGKSDSLIVFTAHYDHLGSMGKKTYFPGANDNASGVAMLLTLAKYYAALPEKPDYSVAFLFFSAEEAGLLGSFQFAGHPCFDLKKIRFLFNLDLVGTGEEGIRVVNSTIFKKEYELLAKINDEKSYLKKISLRGEAANSDHYPFYEKGVKSFFIYTQGGISEYHNIYDRPETLPLTEFSDLFKLLVDFSMQFK